MVSDATVPAWTLRRGRPWHGLAVTGLMAIIPAGAPCAQPVTASTALPNIVYPEHIPDAAAPAHAGDTIVIVENGTPVRYFYSQGVWLYRDAAQVTHPASAQTLLAIQARRSAVMAATTHPAATAQSHGLQNAARRTIVTVSHQSPAAQVSHRP